MIFFVIELKPLDMTWNRPFSNCVKEGVKMGEKKHRFSIVTFYRESGVIPIKWGNPIFQVFTPCAVSLGREWG